MFDFFRNLFDSIWGNDDDDEPEGFSAGDPDEISFSPDTDGFDFSEFIEIEDRVIDDDGGGEFVNEFYSLDDVLAYVDGTPETVLKFTIEPEGQIYHVYRFASE